MARLPASAVMETSRAIAELSAIPITHVIIFASRRTCEGSDMGGHSSTIGSTRTVAKCNASFPLYLCCLHGSCKSSLLMAFFSLLDRPEQYEGRCGDFVAEGFYSGILNFLAFTTIRSWQL